jgi:formylglycine-generating enzyme required for sulfatase activity
MADIDLHQKENNVCHMHIEYCASCQKRISAVDFAEANAFRIREAPYCRACLEKLPELLQHETKSVAPKRAGSSARLKVPDSAPTAPARSRSASGSQQLPGNSHDLKLYWCEKCGKRLTSDDLATGEARDKQVKGVYCKSCAPGVMTMQFDAIKSPLHPPSPTVPVAKKAGTTSATNIPTAERKISKVHMRPAGTSRSSAKFNLLLIAGMAGLLILSLALLLNNERNREEHEARAAAGKRKAGEAAPLAEENPKAAETLRKNAMAHLEEERRPAADNRKTGEVRLEEEERRKQIEERQKLDEAPPAAEAKAKPKTETGKLETPPAKTEPAVAPPGLALPKTEKTAATQTVPNTQAAKAQQLFSAVLKETAPLLAQNKYADVLAVLERKAKEPALADAAELLKQEKADIEAVVELRRSAIEALRKMVGQQVTLKKTFNGKVVNDPKPDVVTLDMGGAQTALTVLDLSLEDVDKYAPSAGNAGADLRLRGIMYFAAGNVAKAKEYFKNPKTLNPEPYLDRLTAIELGETEAAALSAWNKAEALFNRKAMNEAKDAYDFFTQQHGQTKTAAGKAALLKERYQAIEAVSGPPKEVLDLGGGVKLELVPVKAGEFDMGSSDGEENEKPVHEVKISQPYYIGKYDVTVAEFRAFADAAKFQTKAENFNRGWTVKDGVWQEVSGVNWRNPGFKQEDNHPVVVVTWTDAQEFCKWATKTTGRTVRLPTEAEWEYAARGPKSPKYPWGDKWEGILANVADASLRRTGFNMQWGETEEDDGYPFTSPGGAYKNASWCGAYDMAGNVWQWCQDHFNDNYYGESPAVDPQGPASNDAYRVLRGGGWNCVPGDCRSAHRHRHHDEGRTADQGFRVVVECVSSRTP